MSQNDRKAAWDMLCERLGRDPKTSEETDTCTLHPARRVASNAGVRPSGAKPVNAYTSRVGDRLEATLDAAMVSAHRTALQPARTAEVEFQRSYLPRTQLDWVLRCYGRGACTIGTGVRCRFQTKEAAERAGLIWMLDGISPADQPTLARGEAA